MKKTLALTLALIMVLCMLPSVAFALDDVIGTDVKTEDIGEYCKVDYRTSKIASHEVTVEVYVNYQHKMTKKIPKNVSGVMPNFEITPKQGYYYNQASPFIEYKYESSGATYEGHSLGFNKNEATVKVYLFTFENGANVDFTRVVLFDNLNNACDTLTLRYTHGGQDYEFNYTNWNRHVYVPKATYISVEPHLKNDYKLRLWMTADAYGDGANKVLTLKDGDPKNRASENLKEEGQTMNLPFIGEVETPVRAGSYTGSTNMAFYVDSGYKDLVIFMRMNKDDSGEEPQKYTHKLIYDANGGDGGPQDESSEETANTSHTFTVSDTEPTRVNYTFLGWADTADAMVAQYNAGNEITVSGTKTIYAVWKSKDVQTKAITLTYSGNADGEVANVPDTVTKHIPTTETSATFDISADEPTRDGYDFLGWSLNSNATKPDTFENNQIVATADVTLYAVWKENKPEPDIPTPTIDNIDGNIQVNVICTSTTESKTYGLVTNGFTPTPLTLNNGIYECTITVIPSVYRDIYTTDTGITHETDTDYNNDNDNFKARTLKLQYDSTAKKWKPIGYVNPLPVGVKCGKDSHGEQPETTGTIIVKKIVTGNEGDKNKDFTFKVTVLIPIDHDPSEPPIAMSANAVKAPAVRGVDNTATKDQDDFGDENGIPTLYFNLKHGETMKISNLPVDYTYHVEELNVDGYTVTVNDKPTSSKDVGLTKENPEMTLEFKNTKGSTPTPTPTPYNGGGGYYYPTTTPVPVIVIPPKTGDMTVWQSILHFLGIR